MNRQMQSCHNGTVTKRCNRAIRRLEFSFMAKGIHTTGDGCAEQGMTSIPVGEKMVSESLRPSQGHRAEDNATQFNEDSARPRGFLCHSHGRFNARLALCPRSPD